MVILYVDDDEDDRRIFRELLKQVISTFVCIEARNGSEAIRLLSDPTYKAPDIIFLDVNMPVLDGYQTLAEIRKNPLYRTTRAVMFSAAVNPRAQAEYGHLNAEFLKKASSYKEFVEGLRGAITNHKS